MALLEEMSPRPVYNGSWVESGQKQISQTTVHSSDHKLEPVETHNSAIFANGGGD